MIAIFLRVITLYFLCGSVIGQTESFIKRIGDVICPASQANKGAEDDNYKYRIVGGEEIPIVYAPYQVSLRDNNYHFCGGTIINHNTIVTAAHCIVAAKGDLSIRAGSNKLKTGGIVVPVLWTIHHPLYNPNNYDYDVAVLKLRGNLTYSRTIQPIRLAKHTTKWAVNTAAKASGWGVQHEDHPYSKMSPVLQVVVLFILDIRVCQSVYGSQMITSRMLCVGRNGKDSCKGDSGGPLVINEVLAGIISFGAGCARHGVPGVYTNIAAVRDFIEKAAKANVYFT